MKTLTPLLALLLLVGCAGPTQPPAQGTVTGIVSITPCFPVERPGQPPCPPRPGIAVDFQPVAGGTVQTTKTDPTGTYWIDLPAGDYDATVEAGIRREPPRRVTVLAGKTITVNFAVDSGIR
jgi:hypothetical protein